MFSLIMWFIGGPLIYFAVSLFAVMTALTFIKYSRLPRHLRWDLYPVPHQGPEGSKYQKVDFGQLKPHVSLLHELKVMGEEMLFIKKAYINNPKVWKGSFPLHAGLYLGMVWLLLLAVGAIIELNGAFLTVGASSVWSAILYYLTIASGAAGFALGLCGGLVLLWLRISDEGMRLMSDATSYVNLILIICLFGSGLIGWLFIDPSFHIIRHHVAGLLTFNPATVKEPLIVLQMIVFSAFLVYLPFSRMMHFVGKYFFYHSVLWDDEMMKRNSAMENDIATYLQYKVTWSAPHIRNGASWADQVAKEPPKDGENK